MCGYPAALYMVVLEGQKDDKPSTILPTILVEDWDQPEVVKGKPFFT